MKKEQQKLVFVNVVFIRSNILKGALNAIQNLFIKQYLNLPQKKKMEQELEEKLKKIETKIDDLDERFDEVVGLINFLQNKIKI